MLKHMPKLGAALIIIVITSWTGVLVPHALAQRARVPQTGQTTSYALRDDGAIQAGAAWPTPRFTDRGNGTVRDNLTGLIRLKDASCLGSTNWANALAAVANLNTGMNFDCEDYHSGTLTDWRLPNINELGSLVDVAFFQPALSNAAGTDQWTEGNVFSGVQSNVYWSSTTFTLVPVDAWFVHFQYGYTGIDNKGNSLTPYWVWPVRGGE